LNNIGLQECDRFTILSTLGTINVKRNVTCALASSLELQSKKPRKKLSEVHSVVFKRKRNGTEVSEGIRLFTQGTEVWKP
jgi:hypothetical protein